MKHILLSLLFLLVLGEARGQEFADTVWVDSATLGRIHLLRIAEDDTIRRLPANAIKPVLESLGINHGVWAWDHYVTDRPWADINGRTVSRNLRHNWVLDHDSYSGNQFSHPYHGSMFYASARYHGHSYYTAAVYPLVGSMVWEYFCETNLPSYNDFLSTGIGGTALGEALFRTSDLVFDDSRRGFPRVLREVVGSLLSPSRGIHRLFSGEAWTVTPARGKMVEPEPFQFNLGVGDRVMTEFRHQGRRKHVPYLDFDLRYGDRFDYDGVGKPFDYFKLHLLLNLASDNPTISDADIRGRILGRSFDTRGGWQCDLGLYQNFRYVDNYGGKHGDARAGDFPLFAEAASFGVGLYAEKNGRKATFSNDFSLNGIGFGAVANEHYPPRRYSFASGFSLRDNVSLSFYGKGRLGCDAYFGRYYVPKGTRDPQTGKEDYLWGTRGHNSVFFVRSYLEIPVWNFTCLSVQHVLWYRRSQYDYYPDHHGKSSELLVGLSYSI